MWYILYAAELIKKAACVSTDDSKKLIMEINEYIIIFSKTDLHRILIYNTKSNLTFLEVTVDTVEDFIKLLKQLDIFKAAN